MVDDYHRDTGEGADLYSAGRTRGCGGSGLWRDGKLYSAAELPEHARAGQGPIRVMFELMYEPFDAGGAKVTETKRITLDAGHHLNRFEIMLRGRARRQPLSPPGIRNQSRLAVADHPRRPASCAPGSRSSRRVTSGAPSSCPAWPTPAKRTAITSRSPPRSPDRACYYAGSAWDRGGHIKSVEEWDTYLTREAARGQTPVEIRSGADQLLTRTPTPTQEPQTIWQLGLAVDVDMPAPQWIYH